MKVIVINTTVYREKDIIVNALHEKGLISFKIRGGANGTNPFIWLNNPLTVAEVEFVEPNKYKYPVLLRADLLKSPQQSDLSLEGMLAVNLFSEATFKSATDDEKYLFYEDLLDVVGNLPSNKSDILTMVLIYLAKAIKIAGLELEVDGCVHCGSKENIVAFSFEDGGFVCKLCLQGNVNCDLSVEQMKLVRFIFKAPKVTYKTPEIYTDEDKKILLSKLNVFLTDIAGIELQSINILLKD